MGAEGGSRTDNNWTLIKIVWYVNHKMFVLFSRIKMAHSDDGIGSEERISSTPQPAALYQPALKPWESYTSVAVLQEGLLNIVLLGGC
ncbi:MAG: hypothetical protein EBU88_10330 [Acidobacteria bacterium]|nr:hypothetical protein [Acidobacteriota bacterium]